MKRSISGFLISCGFLIAQAPPPLKSETVIATVDGRKLTYGEIDAYLNALGPQRKAAALAAPEQLVKEYAFQQKLVEFAEKEKLAETSPYKEALEVSRRAILTEAEFNYKSLHLLVTPDDQKEAYEAHKDRYTEVRLREIYITFTTYEVAKENPKKYRNEAQAKALALRIRAEAKTDADFILLVSKYSEDETSKARNGEYGSIKKSDNIPAEIKDAVFALKQDEVSQPVKQQNGFYLFRAMQVGLRPYEEVKDEIYSELKDARMREWIASVQKGISIQLENDAFFHPPAASK